MSNLSVDTTQLDRFVKRMKKAGKKNPKNIKTMFKTIGAIVGKKARTYAPRSMTKSEYVSTLVGGVTERNTTSFTSGSLKNSITTDVFKDRVEISVPSNSAAGKYAEKMHDEKGKTWKRVGWQNDSKATDKYITKAYEDSTKDIDRALDNLLDKLIRDI